jgi:hypothetical protein
MTPSMTTPTAADGLTYPQYTSLRVAKLAEQLALMGSADSLEALAYHCHQAWLISKGLERSLRRNDAKYLYRLNGRGYGRTELCRMVGTTHRTLDKRLRTVARWERLRDERARDEAAAAGAAEPGA